MELGSLIGIIAGIFFIILSILLGAEMDVTKFGAFIDAPSALIVIGGTISAMLVANPMPVLMNALKNISKIFKAPDTDPTEAITKIIDLANLARKEGLLALEDAVANIDDEFLKKGVMLIVDGTDPELVRNILETELTYQETRHKDVSNVWELLGALAPAWGMIGTLIGLVLMLLDLSNPDLIGPKMAVAIITTFYGSIIANFIAIPTANKMKIFSNAEILMKEVLIEGMLSIQAGENPRIIEEKLKSFLSPTLRESIGEGGGE